MSARDARIGRIGLRAMLRAGGRAIATYTGTTFAVFTVQTVVALMCVFVVGSLFVVEFSHHPIFDSAVDGDLIALAEVVRSVPQVFIASWWIVLGIGLLWTVTSWFLIGGIIAVLRVRPEGRSATARCFGAGGADTFLAYLRLSIVTALANIPALFIFVACLAPAAEMITHALTLTELAGGVALAFGPALAFSIIIETITDYARVDLSLSAGYDERGVLRAFARAALFVVRNPRSLLHAVLGWVLIIGVSLGYVGLTHGRDLFGTSGAITIFLVRQSLSLIRVAIKIAILGGQLELGGSNPLPRRPPTAIA